MIKINKLHKVYNAEKANAFEAIKGVNVDISEGEMIAITGKSGSGKSTLLHVIGCIDTFEAGEYFLDKIPVHEIDDNQQADIRNRKVGIVMQDFALIESYTVIENVMIPAHFKKGSKKEMLNSAHEALKSVGIDDIAKKDVNKLSGGQKQRVAIARAIVNNPSIILADEPTGSLDSKTSGEIMELFKKLNAMGKTVIIITHDHAIADMCERIIEITDGKIL